MFAAGDIPGDDFVLLSWCVEVSAVASVSDGLHAVAGASIFETILAGVDAPQLAAGFRVPDDELTADGDDGFFHRRERHVGDARWRVKARRAEAKESVVG